MDLQLIKVHVVIDSHRVNVQQVGDGTEDVRAVTFP